MKSKFNFLAIAAIVALGGSVFGLASCEGTPEIPAPVELDTYSVTLNAGSGSTIALSGSETEFEAGDEVRFTVSLEDSTTKELTAVNFGDTGLAVSATGSYVAIMPAKDVVISTTIGDIDFGTFAITLEADTGTTIEILSAEAEGGDYLPGSEISFKVAVENELLTQLDGVTVDEKAVKLVDGVGSFVMPSKDVVIKTEATTLGDGSILNVADVDETALAAIADLEGVKSLLSTSATLEKTHVNGGTRAFDTSYRYDEVFSYEYEVGSNGVLNVEGRTASSASSSSDKYDRTTYALLGEDKYYRINNNGGSVSANLYDIVDDEAESVSTYGEIRKSVAEGNVSGLDISTTISGLLNSSLAIDNKAMSEDKKQFTIELSAVSSSYYTVYFYETTLTFDSDSLLREASIKEASYDSDDYSEETGLAEGAVANNNEEYHYTLNRGYRRAITPVCDIKDYVFDSYKVNTTGYFSGSYTYLYDEGGEVSNGSTLSFTFRSDDKKDAVLLPRIVGYTGEEGIVTIGALSSSGTQSVTVNKEGAFTLTFDNGLGVQKTLEYTSTKPKPTYINASLSSSNIFVGSSATLTVSVAPEQADQSVVVTLDESSTCTATITKNDDGTYDIQGDTAGSGVLNIASAVDSSISTKVSFEVAEPPVYEDVYALMTTYTLTGTTESSGNYYELCINFNDDGTGEYLLNEYYYSSWDGGSVVTFDWTIDQDTFAVTLSNESGNSVYGTTVSGIAAISSTSFSFTASYYGSGRSGTLTSYGSRVDDLSTLARA